MPTQSTTYNSRVTDEALEKRFRDTFRSQGGAELVDDLYAQGVIVPVVDFTEAAQGFTLPEYLQTAWDFTTGEAVANNSTVTIANNAGFWLVKINLFAQTQSGTGAIGGAIQITDGTTTKRIWASEEQTGNPDLPWGLVDTLTVFLRSGDTLQAVTNNGAITLVANSRQVADSSGNVINPSGFTSS